MLGSCMYSKALTHNLKYSILYCTVIRYRYIYCAMLRLYDLILCDGIISYEVVVVVLAQL